MDAAGRRRSVLTTWGESEARASRGGRQARIRKSRFPLFGSCSRLPVGVEAEEHQYAAYHVPRLRPGIARRTSTDWNERNGDHRRCRSRQSRGSSSLHAGCDAALFGIHFGRVANHEMHDGQASTVESGMPGGDGTRNFPPRVSALLSALQTLHARLLPLIS